MITSPSRSFFLACLAFCLGILIGPLFRSVSINTLFFPLAICFVFYLFETGKDRRLIWIIAGLFLFGIFRYVAAIPTGPTAANFVGPLHATASEPVSIEGRIHSEVLRGLRTTRAQVAQLTINDALVEGQIVAYFSPDVSFAYNDQVSFRCKLDLPEPIESFRYDLHLQSQGIYAVCGSPAGTVVTADSSFHIFRQIYTVKDAIGRRLHDLYPEPHASFLGGLLFGGSSALSSDLKNDFSRVGVSHILAASGFNLSLFTFVFLGWIMKTSVGRKRGVILTAVLIFVFVVMAGITSAVLRAALMSAMLLIALIVRRKPFLPNVIILAVCLMLLLNPLILLYDVGFQLSFIATIALMTLSKHIEPHVSFLPDAFGIREAIVGSTAAIVATLPIVLWHFGSISIVAPVANLLILPLVPPAMGLVLLSLVVSIFLPPFSSIVAFPAWAISHLILYLIHIFGSLSYASVPVVWNKPLAVIVAIGMISFLLWRFRHHVRDLFASKARA